MVQARGPRGGRPEWVRVFLLGRMGGPTWGKWSFVPKKGDKPKYIAVNGDESEPGTFKDRYILERSPHMMLEGAAIAARDRSPQHLRLRSR